MPVAAGIWGEGFADDGWADTLTVARFDQLHPDEAFRLFPRLVGTAEARSAVAARLEAALLHAPGAGDRLAAARPGWPPWPRLGRPLDARVGEMATAVLHALRARQVPAFGEGRAFAVATVAGLHPAYVWPEAAVLADRLTAAGWVGVVARGRPALMPLLVAEVLAGAVTIGEPRRGRLRDPGFSACGLSDADWACLARFAERRLRGKRDVVRLPGRRLRPSFPRLGLPSMRGVGRAVSP